jgi:predicted alpha/beta hydrolase family esterase
MTNMPILIVPGFRGSGPLHWQSLWQQSDSAFQRVAQLDWNKPALHEWLESLDNHIAKCETSPILVAHSLGCSLVAHWVKSSGRSVRATLLVCPSDVDSPANTPSEVRGFSPMPLVPFPFRSIVVASTNDPRVTLERANFFAHSWGSRFVTVRAGGHMNENSALGTWPQGRELLSELLRGA